MKRFLKILLFIIIAAGVVIGSILTIRAVNNRGAAPVGWWKMDEGQGQTTYDASGNGNNGTLGASASDTTPDPTWKNEESCKNGKCLNFDGVDDYVGVSGPSFSSTAPWTIALWSYNREFKYAPLIGHYSYNPIIVLNSGTLQLRDVNGAFHTLATNLSLNQWNQFSIVADGAGGIKTYLNGLLVTTDSFNTTFYFDKIGGYMAGGDVYNYFNGLIDDVRVYNYARSAAQIKADYNKSAGGRGASVKVASLQEQQNASDGLVGYWKMDEASWAGVAGEVVDSSGAGNNGAAVGGASTTTAAKFGRAGNFDGGDDYVSVADSELWNFGSNDFTINYWIKWNGTPSGIDSIIGQSSGGGTVTKWHVIWGINSAYAYTGTHMRLKFIDAGLTVRDVAFAWVPNGNQWYHLSFTRSGSDWKFYVDGVQTGGTQTLSATMPNVANILQIGSDGESWNFFPGQIDDVKIYNKARTAEQIRRDYETGPPPVAHLRMDENTGQYANDTSGTNNGTLGTGATADASDPQWTNGKYGNALKFDGVDDYVNCSNPVIPTTNFTLGAWINRSSVKFQNIIVQWKAGTTGRLMFTLDGDDKLNLYIGGVTIATSPNAVGGGWHYVSVAHQAGSVNLYVDGILVSSGTNSNDIEQTVTTRIGQGDCFNGLIDDVRIYNYARTQRQIMEDMNAGHPAVGSPVGSYVGYWNFDEGNGDTAYDKSVNKNNGDLVGSCPGAATCPAWTTAGKFGKALSFDEGDYVDVASSNSFAFGTGDFSWGVWVNSTSFAADNNYVLDFGSNGGLIQYYVGILRYYNPTTGSSSVLYTGAATLNTNTWYYITIVRFSGITTMYINGVAIKSAADTHNYPAQVLRFGDYGGGGSYGWNGFIDDVKIYPFALSPAEIKQEYNRGASLVLGASGTDSLGNPDNSAAREYCVPGDITSCAAPVAHWKMDEKADNTCSGGVNDVCDTSGNGNDGANTGGPVWKSAASCKIGSCLSFDGTDDYVEIADSPSLNIQTALTVSAWIKLDSTRGSGVVVGRWTSTGSNRVWLLQMSATNQLSFFTSPFGDEWATKLTTTNSFSQLGRWYHFVGTFNAGTPLIYVDGVLQAATQAGTPPTTLINKPSTIRIGQYTVADPGADFPGSIDDVRIYNYARTPAQIAWDYNRGGPVGSWSMDSVGVSASPGTALNVYDSSGNANTGVSSGETMNNGTLTGGPTWKDGSNCKYGSCLSFDGSNDYVVSANNVGLSGDFTATISAWIKFNSLNNSGYHTLVAFGATGVTQGFAISQATPDSSQIRVAFFGGVDYGGYTATGAVTTGQWYHLVATKTAGAIGASTTKLYINGVSQSLTFGSSATPNMVDGKLYVGSDSASEWSNSCSIDNVRIYNTALTDTQVAALYNNNDRAAGASLEANLVGEWRLDENAGLYAADTHYQRNGKYGYAMNFDGSNDYVSVADSASLNFGTGNFTLSLWIKNISVSSDTVVLSKYGTAPNWQLFIYRDTTYIEFFAYDPDVKVQYFAGGFTKINDGQWHLITLVENYGVNGMLYIDGNLYQTSATTFTSLNNSANSLKIGEGYNGLIDDVRVYNYALNATQIKTLYNENAAVRFGPTEGLP